MLQNARPTLVTVLRQLLETCRPLPSTLKFLALLLQLQSFRWWWSCPLHSHQQRATHLESQQHRDVMLDLLKTTAQSLQFAAPESLHLQSARHRLSRTVEVDQVSESLNQFQYLPTTVSLQVRPTCWRLHCGYGWIETHLQIVTSCGQHARAHLAPQHVA